MKSARVVFKGGIPFSPEFDDIYFNADDPIGQSEYVFNSVFDEIWSKKSEFNVLETGFGAGLNFLCAFKRFKNSDKFLNFVSIEKTPIARDDLAKIYANFSELADVSGELLDAYPPLIRGFHRLNLAPNVTLTLCFGDVAEVLDELSFIADAVFMDGFAPAKNEAMWSERVCGKIANLCAFGASVCTYSASGALKRALQNSGFEVNLLKGYGKKREMLRAKFAGERQARSEIWFSRFDPAGMTAPKSALIIGGGVAGCVCAFKLRERGLEVTIAEKHGDIALNGSGNHCGILMPLITKPTVNLGRMHMNAFLQAAHFYGQNLGAQEIEFCGATDYAFEQKTLERFYEWREFDADNGVFELKFEGEPYASAFIFSGAKARPRKMCKAASAGIKTLLNCEFTGFETLEGGAVRTHFKDGQSIDADVLVLAVGSESMEFFADYDIRLSSVRGQVTHIEPAVWTSAPFSAKGYVCPPAQGVQVIGATYDRNLFLDEPRSSDDEKNLADVAEFLGGKFAKSERVNLSGEQDQDLTIGPDGDAENTDRLKTNNGSVNLNENTDNVEILRGAIADEKIICKFNDEPIDVASLANGENSSETKTVATSDEISLTREFGEISPASFAYETSAEKCASSEHPLDVKFINQIKIVNKNLPDLAKNAGKADGFKSSNFTKISPLANLQRPMNAKDAVKIGKDAKFVSAGSAEFLDSSNLDKRAESLNLTNLKRRTDRLNLLNLTENKDADSSAQTYDAPNSATPENLLNAATKTPPNIRIIGSKVGYRSYSGDRFPLIGRLYDEDFYKDAYKSLLWTKNRPNPSPKYVPNVYASTAHGSRGLCTAVLGAELVCDLIFDRPLCIEKSLFDELHLARFLVRKLKKGLR